MHILQKRRAMAVRISEQYAHSLCKKCPSCSAISISAKYCRVICASKYLFIYADKLEYNTTLILTIHKRNYQLIDLILKFKIILR